MSFLTIKIAFCMEIVVEVHLFNPLELSLCVFDDA